MNHFGSSRRMGLAVLAGGLAFVGAKRVAIDVDAFELFVRPRVALEHWADGRHAIAGVAEGAGFLPHPPVERKGEVFDEDEDVPESVHQVARASRP